MREAGCSAVTWAARGQPSCGPFPEVWGLSASRVVWEGTAEHSGQGGEGAPYSWSLSPACWRLLEGKAEGQ